MAASLSSSVLPSHRGSRQALRALCSRNVRTGPTSRASVSIDRALGFGFNLRKNTFLSSDSLHPVGASFRKSSIGKWNGRFRGICMSVQTEQDASETATFIREVAKLDPPSNLSTLLKILQAKGEKLVDPNERQGIIPLAIPLSKAEKCGTLTALLRWPTPLEGMEIPVVTVEKFGIKLLAKSVDSYIHRVLAEEDFLGRGNTGVSFADATGEIGEKIYSPGSVSSSGISDINVYLMKKVGMFPDVFEKLALNHLERGDVVSALVTGEFYATRKHFPGFGRPYVFNSELLTRLGRKTEAKDYAKIALKSPWWTLGASFQEVSEMASSGETLLEYAKEKISPEGAKEDLVKGKLPEQVALDQAAFLLDICSVDNSWDQNRTALASFYDRGGLSDFAKFVREINVK